jgi:hypothetical protein
MEETASGRRGMMAVMSAVMAVVLGVSLQATPGMAPLPADPPIGGAIWTVVIPALLFLGSLLGTYLLYRRFAKEEGE